MLVLNLSKKTEEQNSRLHILTEKLKMFLICKLLSLVVIGIMKMFPYMNL